MTALAVHPEPSSVDVGRPLPWARDLAIVGAVTGFGVPFLHPLASLTPSLLVALVAAVTGAALGAAAPRLLNAHVRRVPVVLLLGAGAGVGALWGGLVGVVSAYVIGGGSWYLVHLAATIGLVQLGWFWLPYAVLRGRRRPTWSLVVAAVLCTPLVFHLARL